MEEGPAVGMAVTTQTLAIASILPGRTNAAVSQVSRKGARRQHPAARKKGFYL